MPEYRPDRLATIEPDKQKPSPQKETPSATELESLLGRPAELIEALNHHGTFDFKAYKSGLFPASDLPEEFAEATGMGMAWLRDNAHVINSLHESGRDELAKPAGEAMLEGLIQTDQLMDKIIANPDTDIRMPVRFNGNTLKLDTENRAQHDSTGYGIWVTSRLMLDETIEPTQARVDIIAKTIDYLDAVRYWQDYDSGHWEEDKAVHATSIGTVLAGLREAKTLLRQHSRHATVEKIEQLETVGRQTFDAMLSSNATMKRQVPFERSTSDHDDEIEQQYRQLNSENRAYDAAMLFLIEPLGVIQGEQAEKIVTEIEKYLKREKGFARYPGDTYWLPDFKNIMTLEERTSALGDLAMRNTKAAGVAYTKTEAQWTLFDPILSVYWGKQYQVSGDPDHKQKQLSYLKRSFEQLVKTEDGKLQMPEAYYWENPDKLVPNDHTPLLWSQANLQLALNELSKPIGKE